MSICSPCSSPFERFGQIGVVGETVEDPDAMELRVDRLYGNALRGATCGTSSVTTVRDHALWRLCSASRCAAAHAALPPGWRS